jgi:hypothetical protein
MEAAWRRDIGRPESFFTRAEVHDLAAFVVRPADRIADVPSAAGDETWVMAATRTLVAAARIAVRAIARGLRFDGHAASVAAR